MRLCTKLSEIPSLSRPQESRVMGRVLIADQHAVVREGLRKVVEAELGWEVAAEVEDGEAAIRKAIETKPDIVVLDTWLPLVSGTQVTRQIREQLPNTEVLIFTMQDEERLVGEAVRAGARGYVLKSDRNEVLLPP